MTRHQGFYLLNDNTSYLQISPSLETWLSSVGVLKSPCIALQFDMHLGSTAAESPIKYQSSQTSINLNRETLQKPKKKTSYH